MKKIFLGILSFVYLSIACGFAVNDHYCMDKWIGTDYSYSDDHNTCDKCGMDNAKNCCHSEFKIVKLADDQQLAKSNAGIVLNTTILPPTFVDLIQAEQGFTTTSSFTDFLPPPDNNRLPIYLGNCTFRI